MAKLVFFRHKHAECSGKLTLHEGKSYGITNFLNDRWFFALTE